MSNWLKAGLLGAAVVVVLQVLGIIPCVGCVTWILTYVAYGCFGALAAYWLPPRRMPGPAAGQGALAGAIAGASLRIKRLRSGDGASIPALLQ